jgi:UDP-glucose 4-epimerase
VRIYITGVAGFVGSNLADRLLADGHDVWGIDNLRTGRRGNLAKDVVFVHGDVAGGLFWDTPGHADLVVHCAASYKNPDDWQEDVSSNVTGAVRVAEVAREWKCPIVYFQTVLPPISSYAISKIAAEHYLRLSGQPLTVYRLASIYGPRLMSGAIPTFYKRIKADEPCTVVRYASRDFVFIDDLIERVLRFEDPGTYDVRTGHETLIADIPSAIASKLGCVCQLDWISPPADDVQAYDMDGVPHAGTSFRDGLRRTIDWYEENGVGETFTHLKALSG